MKNANSSVPISIVIPTYGREQPLIDTLESVLTLEQKPAQVIVVDQSVSHQPQVEQQLQQWHQENQITWLKLSEPSIPHAMNSGLIEASQATVLFLDDDIKAHKTLLKAHNLAHQQTQNLIVAGRIIQPWDQKQKLTDAGHQFNSSEKKFISHFMGGNFSINKQQAINLGGFDENFIGVAYRFEAEFAERWLQAGNHILFEPTAVIDHLKVTSGGTREYGEHLTTAQPFHAVGAYYFLLVSKNTDNKWSAILKRLVQSVKTRHHMKRPWYIPLTLVAEIRGLNMARHLAKAGPDYINTSNRVVAEI